MLPSGLAQRWDRFWFAEIPPDSYAVLRMAFGIIGLAGLVGLTPVSMYWPLDSIAATPGGGLGLKTQIASLGLGAIAGWTLFSVLVAAFCCMTVGYRTAMAVVVCFAASVVQARWNALPLSASHQVFVSLLFCLVWADCGGVMSLDARLDRGSDPSGFTTRAIWPLRLLRVQVALIYLHSGLWKLFGPTWRDGAAGHDVLSLNVFHRFPVVIPDNLEWLATAVTYGTLFWEIGFFALLLHPWTRVLALIAGVVIHLGLWIMLEVGTFSWIMLASYLAFVEPDRLARVLTSRRPRTRADSVRSFETRSPSSHAPHLHQSRRGLG